MNSFVRNIISKRMLFVIVAALFVFASFSSAPPSVFFPALKDLFHGKLSLSTLNLLCSVGSQRGENAPFSDGRNDEDLPATLRDLCETISPAGFLSIRARNRQLTANFAVLFKYLGFPPILFIFTGKRSQYRLEDNLPLVFNSIKTIRKLE